jgi:hypothetical protein
LVTVTVVVTVVVAVALMVAVEDACPARNQNDNSSCSSKHQTN